MDNAIALAALALFTPLAVAALLVIAYPLRRQGMAAAVLSIAAALISFGAAVALFAQSMSTATAPLRQTFAWLPGEHGALASLGLHLDGISISMLLVVTLVALCVQVFSLGYMADEAPADFGRYFTYHSLFIFSMLLLVLAPNMLQFFLGWELVGLTSYLLIGYYFQKKSAGLASVKAFWVTKFADMGLLLGLLVLVSESGSFEWTASLSSFGAMMVTLLFFMAVMGKSAQFPLHIWLPNAMEGPTPVSALLHAATMVAAGVYLIIRAEPLFGAAPDTQVFMTWVGAITALFAAIIATVQTDIKKVLAYSTCSQLGYMVCALGAGSTMGGYFHLTTHAFFKALLFLAAGSIIHGVHSNELKDMGGLRKTMPLTSFVFVIGALALAGFPGLSGFFSKDLILEAVHAQGYWGPWLLLLAAAFLTAFYMGRVVFLALFGRPSDAAQNAHEGGASMTVPLVLLGALSLGAGYGAASAAGLWDLEYQFHIGLSGLLGTGLGLLGILLSYLIFGNGVLKAERFSWLSPVANLARSGLVDRFYAGMFKHIALVLARGIGWFDRYVIDGIMNYVAWASLEGGALLRKTQTGKVADYLYVLAFAMILLAVLGVWA